MSQLIQFLSNSSTGSSCKKAIAPVVYQGSITVPVASGATAINLVPALIANAKAAFGGQIVNKGCSDLLATILYLTGDDCDECTAPDALTEVPISLVIPKNSSFPLPEGFISNVLVQTINSAGVPTNVQTPQDVDFYSSYQPCCGSSVFVPSLTLAG